MSEENGNGQEHEEKETPPIDHKSPMEFDTLDLIEVPVKIAGVNYVLREAASGAAAEWRNAIIKGATFGDEGKVTRMDGVGYSEALLVSKCLFQVLPNNTICNESVIVNIIRTWPAKVVKALFERVKLISDLNEKDDKKDKKEKKPLPN